MATFLFGSKVTFQCVSEVRLRIGLLKSSISVSGCVPFSITFIVLY